MSKKQNISVGDSVRFVINSYYELSKSEYNMPYLYNNPDSDFNNIMLGGCYTITQIMKNKWGVKVAQIAYNKYEISDIVPISYLTKYIQEEDCIFRQFDRVFFRPKSNIKEVEFLLTVFPQIDFLNESVQFTIEKIINSYYVIVKKIDGEIIDFPLLWTDFELSD